MCASVVPSRCVKTRILPDGFISCHSWGLEVSETPQSQQQQGRPQHDKIEKFQSSEKVSGARQSRRFHTHRNNYVVQDRQRRGKVRIHFQTFSPNSSKVPQFIPKSPLSFPTRIQPLSSRPLWWGCADGLIRVLQPSPLIGPNYCCDSVVTHGRGAEAKLE